MVKAILDGRKTQTRRVAYKGYHGEAVDAVMLGDGGSAIFGSCAGSGYGDVSKCPYGKPGDVLWVRETFCWQCDADGEPPDNPDGRPVRTEWRGDDWGDSYLMPCYRATEPDTVLCYEGEDSERPRCKQCEEGTEHAHWKPSIHMPRWASRISLTVKDVRVERLQDISHTDATWEGCDMGNWQASEGPKPIGVGHSYAVERFKRLWESINGKKHPWSENPWVWVVEFEQSAT